MLIIKEFTNCENPFGYMNEYRFGRPILTNSSGSPMEGQLTGRTTFAKYAAIEASLCVHSTRFRHGPRLKGPFPPTHFCIFAFK